MNSSNQSQATAGDRRVTGISAVIVGALSLVMVPLYFVYSGPPPADNVLSRNLVTVFVFTVFLIFATALKRALGGGVAGDLADRKSVV